MPKTGSNTAIKVIVIGGGSFQGKSLIALHVADKYKIPLLICTDTIRNMLHALNPKSPHLRTSTFLMSPESLEKQMEEVSKVIRKMLPLYDKRGENIILEGMHLSQETIAYFSRRTNALLFCIDNKLSFEKRLRYKSLTRCRVEYVDPRTGEVTYGNLAKGNLCLTPYMQHANRIQEIHQQIVDYFSQENLPVVKFEDIDTAIKRAYAMVEDFFFKS